MTFRIRIGVVVVLAFLALPHFVTAQEDTLTLSVTPPLFQLNVAPGEGWKSFIKVINPNPYEITVYAQVHDFTPKGEDGQGMFIPRSMEEGSTPTLADWINIPEEALVIPAEQSVDVPLALFVPQDAAPGGHFAAILIGTRPPENTPGSLIKTSQVVTSLFFMRVAGDVREVGTIREFSVEHLFREQPEANFIFRFENEGNVHLQPQGGITITNMWGKERGFIPINQRSHFGNVLPQSIRKFDFSWKGEPSLSDIGRYAAEVTVTYGEEGRQNTSSKLYFWVIPLRAALITLAIFGAFIWFIIWVVRRYVQRAISLAGYEEPPQRARKAERAPTIKTQRPRDLASPLKKGVLDLRHSMESTRDTPSRMRSLIAYGRSYWRFFAGVGLGLVFIGLATVYLLDVLKQDKSYEITVDRGDSSVTLSSEEVIHDKLGGGGTQSSDTEQRFDLAIVNTTDATGIGSRVALELEGMGYAIFALSQEPDPLRVRSVIVYDEGLEEEALTLSAKLGNMLISRYEPGENETSSPEAQRARIRIMVGADRNE